MKNRRERLRTQARAEHERGSAKHQVTGRSRQAKELALCQKKQENRKPDLPTKYAIGETRSPINSSGSFRAGRPSTSSTLRKKGSSRYARCSIEGSRSWTKI